METEAVQAMLRDDRAEWDALVAVLEVQPDGPLHDPNSPEWTSRDVYTHLACWMEHSTDILEAHLAGRALPALEGSDDEINARWQAEHSHMSLDEARAWARRAFERRIRAIEAVPPDRCDAAVEAMARADGAGHYRGHRSYISVL
jgi:hypothetical protein